MSGFDKVVVLYHTDESEDPGVHRSERDVSGSKDEARTMFLNDSPQMHSMTHGEANDLASRIARNLTQRNERNARQAERGRTPGAVSRPRKKANKSS